MATPAQIILSCVILDDVGSPLQDSDGGYITDDGCLNPYLADQLADSIVRDGGFVFYGVDHGERLAELYGILAGVAPVVRTEQADVLGIWGSIRGSLPAFYRP